MWQGERYTRKTFSSAPPSLVVEDDAETGLMSRREREKAEIARNGIDVLC